MAKFKYPFPKGSGSLDATTFSMPKRELGSRIVSHQALYNKSRATGKRLQEQHANEPNAFKRTMIGHSAIMQSRKTRALGNTLKGLQTMERIGNLQMMGKSKKGAKDTLAKQFGMAKKKYKP